MRLTERFGATPIEETIMKFNTAQVEQILTQFEARVLPTGHPADLELSELFGNHTFFLDSNGLNILEAADAPQEGVEAGEIVNLADWTDATCTSLRPHEPEPTGVLIPIGLKH
jgi:hypothetical protein